MSCAASPVRSWCNWIGLNASSIGQFSMHSAVYCVWIRHQRRLHWISMPFKMAAAFPAGQWWWGDTVTPSAVRAMRSGTFCMFSRSEVLCYTFLSSADGLSLWQHRIQGRISCQQINACEKIWQKKELHFLGCMTDKYSRVRIQWFE